jgi:beta-galactosidase
VLAIRLDNLFQRNVLPGRRDPDFLLHGGLAGRIWLEWVPALHIDTDRVEVACTPAGDGAENLTLRCGFNGLESLPDNPRLSWIIRASDGGQIAAAGPTSVADDASVITAMLSKPRCWTPNDPQLYWAEVRLETDDGPEDVVRVRFGVTRAEFRPDEGFFLDGVRVDLHGCNRHAAIPGLGNALPDELHRADARLLKDYGCNFVRLSHYPQHPAFLDACDELGIMVYAEIATWKTVRSSGRWRRAARRQMRGLILRDRHHPSVILWGMGNESRSRKAYLELSAIARELDPARPVTYAENHLYRARRERTTGIPDVWGVNYELDVLAEARDASRLRNVVLSECCNHPTSVKGDDDEELTQVETLEREWQIMADRSYLAGHAVWAFTDYATEYRKRFRRLTGLFDAWRRPKMAAELFRARYAEEPFVSLFFTGRAGEKRLHIFTNCELVRLTRDDTQPVELKDAIHHTVNLEGGFTIVRAEGVRGGVSVRNELRAWGEAATVSISVDESEVAAGRTIAVDLSICDDTGTPVRDWNGQIRVAAEGDARIFPYTDAGEVLMARGEGRAYLELGHSGGEIVITAAGEDLVSGSTRITPSGS